jgi:DmsE family decaheme c-type cytochrome
MSPERCSGWQGRARQWALVIGQRRHLVHIFLGLMCAGAVLGQAPPAGYVNSTTCQLCHEDIYNNFQKTVHTAIGTGERFGLPDRACESCHGPGARHVQTLSAADIRNPAKLSPNASIQVCLACHLNQQTPVGSVRSSHSKEQITCIVCHSIHGSRGLVARTIPAINQQCSGCHVNVWAQFQRPYRHFLPQEAMSCVDCHDPHGTIKLAMIRTFSANEVICYRCHANTRGPFTFEHPAVRFEGCGACHVPHGSANPFMLVRAQVMFVCLECHANLPNVNRTGTIGVVPPAFHDLRSPLFQNCTVCHQKVHGSYVDRFLLR